MTDKTCHAYADTASFDARVAIVKPDDHYKRHPLAEHQCNGEHHDLGGITVHTCQCGSTFYYMREAIAVLVEQYEDLLNQLEIIEP